MILSEGGKLYFFSCLKDDDDDLQVKSLIHRLCKNLTEVAPDYDLSRPSQVMVMLMVMVMVMVTVMVVVMVWWW